MCWRTVLKLIPNCSAISLYNCPFATSSNTSLSLGLSAASFRVGAFCSLNTVTSFRAMDALMGEPPACNSFIDSMICVGAVFFNIYPLAPALSASKTWSLLSYTVNIMNCIAGTSFFTCLTHSMPDIPGKLMSTTTISGFNIGNSSAAASVVRNAEINCRASSFLIKALRPSITSSRSSTITTLIFSILTKLTLWLTITYRYFGGCLASRLSQSWYPYCHLLKSNLRYHQFFSSCFQCHLQTDECWQH